MTDRAGKFCKLFSISLCNEQLAFGSWHHSANFLTLILLKLR